MEATTPLRNKLRQHLLHLAGECSGASEGLLSRKLAGSGDLLAALDLIGSSSPSLVSFVIGTGDAGLFDGILGRYVYQHSEKSG